MNVLMLRKSWAVLLLAAMGAWMVPSVAQAKKKPVLDTPLPSNGASSNPDDAYNVLMTRSIFSKDHNRPSSATIPQTRPADSAAPSTGLSEAGLVLRGVGLADGQPTAFFEGITDQQIVKVHLGDQLLRGTITAGSLDGVDYVIDGKATHVLIGQSLDGGVPVVRGFGPTTVTSSGNNAYLSEHPSGEKPKWWHSAKK